MTTVADLYDDDLEAFESDLEDARMQADHIFGLKGGEL